MDKPGMSSSLVGGARTGAGGPGGGTDWNAVDSARRRWYASSPVREDVTGAGDGYDGAKGRSSSALDQRS